MDRFEENLKSNLVEFVQSIVIAIGICVVIYVFLATPNQIQGQSMDPTFAGGEIVLTSKVHQWLGGTPFGKSIGLDYKRGDVVVFQKPGLDDFIKRVIGLPGDSIQIKNGNVYVNGNPLIEPYLDTNVKTKGGTFIEDNGQPQTLGADEYFMLGDNRGNSRDSRYTDVGFIKREWLKGFNKILANQ
jgi:signal peptidase I